MNLLAARCASQGTQGSGCVSVVSLQVLTRPPKALSYVHVALVAAVCAASLYFIREGLLVIAEVQHPWITGDWLINYDGGFVRRGLGGEVLLGLASATGANPAWLVAQVQFVFYAIYLVALVIALAKRTVGLPLFLVCISPVTIVFPLLDIATLGRKEVILFAFYAVFVLVVARPAKRLTVRCAVLGVLAVLATLLHEVFAFYTLYFVLAELLAAPAGVRRVPYASLAVVAGASVTLVALLAVGSTIDGDAVCRQLIANGLSPESCEGAMHWPVRSLGDEVLHTFEIAADARYGLVYGRGALLGLLPFLALWLTSEELRPRMRLVGGGVAMCMVWAMPLFFTAVDWGRFLNIHFVLLMLLMVQHAPRASDASPRAPLTPKAIGIYALALVVGVLLQMVWSLPHCCRPDFGAGILGMFR